MVDEVMPITNQPMSSGLFGQGQWLTEFITPNSLEVQTLYQSLTNGVSDQIQRLTNCWHWVATQIDYVAFIQVTMTFAGKRASKNDYWALPGLTIRTKIGNCATKSFVLCSLLRNELSESQVFCVFGNLYDPNGQNPGGHAWIGCTLSGVDYIMESTRSDVPPLILANSATSYQAIHEFNDTNIYVLNGETQMLPFTKDYSEWLKDYLDFAYINGGK